MSKSNVIHVEASVIRDKMHHKGKMSTNEKKALADELKRTIPDMVQEALSQVSIDVLSIIHKELKGELLNTLREDFKYKKLTKYSPELLRLISLEYDNQVQELLMGYEEPNRLHFNFSINLNLFILIGVFVLGFWFGTLYA